MPVMRSPRLAAAILALAALAGPAAAQPPAAPGANPPARVKVVVAPLATLGAESTSSEMRAAQRLVARGLVLVGSVDVVGHAAMLDAVKKARRPELRACDGDAACLGELGRLVSADYAVYGEVGGLGRAQVVYLKLFDAREPREIRSTVLELGGVVGGSDGEARAAATRLLAPARYRGELELESSVRGASIFIDGRLVARSPARPISLAVGSHALRVTHPEYRDFVRFVEIEFGTTAQVAVDLRPYAEVAGDIHRTGRPIAPAGRDVGALPTPWYRRWYAVAGGGVLLVVTSAVVVGLATGGLSFDREKDL
jgi:hypothetical protein